MNCIKKITYVIALLCMTTGATFCMDIFQAAKTGNIGRIEELLANGADVNQQDNKGMTALHFAAINGGTDIIRILIDASVNLNQQDTALHLPVRNIMAETRVNPLNPQEMPWAGRLQREAIVCRLIELGADVNQQNNDGKTALDLAIAFDKHTIVASLKDYIQRIKQARQRAPVIAHTLALATHPRLGAASPSALLPQDLLRYITRLTAVS